MNDCRRLLRGDENALRNFTMRANRNQKGCAVINYVTNHDGFTLADLVSYDHKYNRENGEQERDGTDYNYSWNCGTEGPTRKKDILRLRMQQRKNAMAMLLLSQGTPMLLAGDEFGNSQGGNNNPYCHDSELTWLDWNHEKANRELQDFIRDAIAYRKRHKVLHQTRVRSVWTTIPTASRIFLTMESAHGTVIFPERTAMSAVCTPGVMRERRGFCILPTIFTGPIRNLPFRSSRRILPGTR